LEELVNLCLQSGITRIYISSDGSKGDNDREDVSQVGQEIARLIDLHPGKIVTKLSSVNLGAAVNVLSSCDWVFDQEDFALILEDDCIPSTEFFTFVFDYKDLLKSHANLYLICGTQFAPESLTKNLVHSSKYPMVWGWASHASKWSTLTSVIKSSPNSNFRLFKMGRNDSVFWRAGARRAIEGFVDAWDIPLVNALREVKGKVIVPGANLVTNIGGDDKATHTINGSDWINTPIGTYAFANLTIVENNKLDNWIEKHVFRIRFKHQISTRITYLFDRLHIYKPSRKSLLARWRDHS
jgi:hypothetical protein